jgi:hypothetical protein
MCADFMAGHEIDPLKYKEFWKIKPQYVDAQYRLAMPHLNLLSGVRQEVEITEELALKVMQNAPIVLRVLKLMEEKAQSQS